MDLIGHLCTIMKHKTLVMKSCFQVGLYQQGLLHDLSKFGPLEFSVGCKYYSGEESPNSIERKIKGYSSGWLHHKGRNKHHNEYWTDYSRKQDGHGQLTPVEIPVRYVAEMLLDRIAACKVYQGSAYTEKSPLEYYESGKEYVIIHEKSRKLLEYLLHFLVKNGERKTFTFIRTSLLKNPDIYRRIVEGKKKPHRNEGKYVQKTRTNQNNAKSKSRIKRGSVRK